MSKLKFGKLVIAIDYEGTFNKAPEMWAEVILTMKEAGHEVICVTQSPVFDPTTGNKFDFMGIEKLVDDFIFARTQWKRWAAMDRGYEVDIWIEDRPEYVGPLAIQEYLAQNKGNKK